MFGITLKYAKTVPSPPSFTVPEEIKLNEIHQPLA
jgi:hypothetical protein